MPIYRKLHTKITDSFDVNDMPDDFHRLLWTWLPLVLCKEGRGFYHGEWLKGKLMPFRDDITGQVIIQALDYFVEKKLIITYEACGRKYFYIPTWHEYQNTSRDAPSPYPEPPIDEFTQEQVTSNSGANHAKTREDKRENDKTTPGQELDKLFQTDDLSVAFEKASGILAHTPPKWTRSLDEMRTQGITPDDIRSAVQELQDKEYSIVGIWSIQNAAISCMAKRKNGGKKKADIGPSGKPRGHKI